MSPIDLARSYLEALETRAPVAAIAELLHEEAVIEVLPNRLDPRGSRRTRAEALADVERGRVLLREECYEVTSAIADATHAALEVTWTGVLAIAAGALPAGATMRARCSMHFQVREGRIVEQRNYDCFDT
jgi:ketosteroid isomerase-like protein